MYTTRAIARSSRAVRINNAALRRNVRFQSDSATSKAASQTASVAQNPWVIGSVSGLLGGSIAFYIWYSTSGLAAATKTARQAKSYYDKATSQLKVTFQENTPEPSEALQALKDAANKYAGWVPGGKQYVDKIFDDLEMIRKRHGEEVDNIVSEAYGELRSESKKGMSLETVSGSWQILQKHLQRLAGLAGDATEDILNNHPELKERLGVPIDQLKQLGQQMGPEVQKSIDETWSQVSDILKEGISFSSADKIRKLVQDKQQQIRQMGEQAFDKGFEQVKPMLGNNPQLKQLVENNMDTLRQGNVSQVIPMIQTAVSGGNTLDLEKYIVNAKEKAQQQFSSGGLNEWLNMIPQGGKILPQLQKLKSIAEQQGPQAQQLAQETLSEIGQVLEKKAKKYEDLYNQSKQQASK
ncbi:hypothetical protein BAUCODRAFT_37900 [Baudoinia panamericana UAMH 10762]|uniref:Uncharacterized protein n=1 Tax=Baudoinia panamericana (strain UAMH 10762) TaxID=717646 RepID=M2M9D2_BAUPA|nr:uncharacterized protein BAUCODRAFT_37900 [Baudoinia panamericana UAMH 10762]EMC92991.1 hypothetical protein BAUCODRAFT_37900 [Baudoinia panamericana UAMH 10762]